MAWYNFIYQIEDGELERASGTKYPFKSSLRDWACLSCILVCLNGFRAEHWTRFFTMLTCWALESTTFAWILEIILS